MRANSGRCGIIIFPNFIFNKGSIIFFNFLLSCYTFLHYSLTNWLRVTKYCLFVICICIAKFLIFILGLLIKKVFVKVWCFQKTLHIGLKKKNAKKNVRARFAFFSMDFPRISYTSHCINHHLNA